MYTSYENCRPISMMSSSDDDGFCQPTDDNIPIIEPDIENLQSISSVENLIDDPCLKNQVDKTIDDALNSTLVSNLKSALGLIGADEFKIEIVEDIIFSGTDQDAETVPVNAYNIQIGLNPDLAESSQEYITATIYHEFLHAIWSFHRMKKELHDTSYTTPILTKLDNLASTGLNINDSDHSLMFSDYMTELRNAVKSIHPDIEDSDLEAITLYGITPLTPEQDVINSSHRNGNSGTICN